MDGISMAEDRTCQYPQSSMLSKNGSLVNFSLYTNLHSNYRYLFADREAQSERCEYSVHSWASTT